MYSDLDFTSALLRKIDLNQRWHGLASLPQEVNRVIELSQEQWHQYVHGDVINIDADLPNGWYLLVCEEHTAGFGKLVGKTIKNFYPKGLRF